MSSLRSKLEDFFTPGPQAKKQQAQAADLEDPVDLYNHTQKFFKADKKTDAYADQIEVGERRLRQGLEEMELDEKIYGGKKISRKELLNAAESEEESEDEDDDDDEDMEDDMEEMEDESEIEDDMESEGSEKPKAKQGHEDGEEEDLDLALKQLKDEEKDETNFIQQRVTSEVEKGKSVRIQKKVFDQFLHQRILMQKLLQTANRLPSNPALIKAYCSHNPKI